MISPRNKLLLKRFVARQLRRLVDLIDDRLHAWEVSLRGEISIPLCVESPRTTRTERPTMPSPGAVAKDEFLCDRIPGRMSGSGEQECDSKSLPTLIRSAAKREPERSGETTPARVSYLEWEARKSGVVVSARPRRKRVHRSAAEFDRELREHFCRRSA